MIHRKVLEDRGPLSIVMVLKGLLLLVAVIVIGTMGYMIIEKWGITDAFYMTVITITTVGYREIREVSEQGRIFTIILIFMGMGILAYTLGMVAQTMVEFQLSSIFGRRKMGSEIKKLKNHYIVCGYGRIGKIISQELMLNRIHLIVIDNNPELKRTLEQNEMPYIIDDATNEDVLIEAGIERAKGLVSAVPSDSDNLFITMTARGLNRELYIISRAEEEHSRKKIIRGGANHVALPHHIGGQKMAHMLIKPAVTQFLESTVNYKGIEVQMEELLVAEGSALDGVTLEKSGIRQKMNVIIVAIRKKSGEMFFNPFSHSRIETGDILIALGPMDDLRKLAGIAAGIGA